MKEINSYYDSSNALTLRMAHMLSDTIRHYGNGPARRAPGCVVESSGNVCVLGRYTDSDRLIEDHGTVRAGASTLLQNYPSYCHPLLFEVPLTFLNELVSLHDNDSNWSWNKGLSASGRTTVQALSKKYGFGLFDYATGLDQLV